MRKKKPIKERIESMVDKCGGCWNWKGHKSLFGYGQIKINGSQQMAHRVTYELYVGRIPKGLCVLHKCDNPSCCNPDHLFLGTMKDNVIDCMKKGRRSNRKGENNNNAKLTEIQVKEIRRKHESGARGVELAREYNVSKQTISSVVCRIAWGWL